MALCPIVSIIHGLGPPEESELLLVYPSVAQPVELHLHGFHVFWLHPVFMMPSAIELSV